MIQNCDNSKNQILIHVYINLINQSTPGILYIFRNSRTGLVSVKIGNKFLAITNFVGQ